MKLKEKLAREHADKWPTITKSIHGRAEESYLQGFQKARELASDNIQNHFDDENTSQELYEIYTRIVKLGEEEIQSE